MSTEDRPKPSYFAMLQARNMWLRAEAVLEEDILLPELGFPGRSDVEDVVMMVIAGDRLHPTEGFDFLGADWKKIAESQRFRLLDQRRAAVEGNVNAVINTLISCGYVAACEVAKTVAPYQVVFLADTEPETAVLIQELIDVGLGVNELSDSDFGKQGTFLYFRWDEVLSYYIL
jgi:hypothetical protein